MWKQYVTTILLVGAALFLLGIFPGSAAAQHPRASHVSLARQPAGLSELKDLLRRPFVPVRLYTLEVPDTLVAGVDAPFAARANVGAASLPLRAAWDFGDGGGASGLNARHRYAAPGRYAVRFTLSNAGSDTTGTRVVTVVPPGDAAVPRLRRLAPDQR